MKGNVAAPVSDADSDAYEDPVGAPPSYLELCAETQSTDVTKGNAPDSGEAEYEEIPLDQYTALSFGHTAERSSRQPTQVGDRHRDRHRFARSLRWNICIVSLLVAVVVGIIVAILVTAGDIYSLTCSHGAHIMLCMAHTPGALFKSISIALSVITIIRNTALN